MKNGGFSLLEMLIVLSIIGIIAAIGSINYIRWINATRADAAAADVGRYLERASGKVRTTNKDVTLTVDKTSNLLILKQGGVKIAETKVDANIKSLTCNPACTSTATTVTALAPFGGYANDVTPAVAADIKIVIERKGATRSVYALGPSALLKVVRN